MSVTRKQGQQYIPYFHLLVVNRLANITPDYLESTLTQDLISRPNMIDRLGAITKGTAFVEVLK